MARFDRNCRVCGKAFSTYRESTWCCSRVCGHSHRVVGPRSKCQVCGVMFRAARKAAKFCGMECYGRHRSRSVEIAAAMKLRRDFFATRDELEDLYHGRQMSQDELAAHFRVSRKKVWGLMRHYGIRTRPQTKRNQTGPLNSYWKGGVIRYGKYRYVKDPGHPNSRANGYVAEHIKVATEAAGRVLAAGECVHHLDGDKEHNAPTNLFITTDDGHAKLHRELETIGFALFRAGLLEFRDGHYVLAEKLATFAGLG